MLERENVISCGEAEYIKEKKGTVTFNSDSDP